MTPLAATESERLKVDRKSFEEWAIGPDGPWTTRAVTQRVGDGYGVPDLQTQWECWQAARASQKSAAQATAEPVDPANKHCRWPMCESEAVQQQIAEEVAESIFGIAAPDRAPSTDSAADARDAARYKWLRHADLDAMAAQYWPDGEVPEGEALDVIVDAAIAASMPQKKGG